MLDIASKCVYDVNEDAEAYTPLKESFEVGAGLFSEK